MNSLFDFITEWLKQGLIEAITVKYSNIFESVNQQVGDVTAQEVTEVEKIRRGVYDIIREENRRTRPTQPQDMEL